MITDPAECIIADGLNDAGISFVHETQNKDQKLDFFLPDFGVFIEVKQFSTPRTADQIKDREDVIVVQGKHAARQFVQMLGVFG